MDGIELKKRGEWQILYKVENSGILFSFSFVFDILKYKRKNSHLLNV